MVAAKSDGENLKLSLAALSPSQFEAFKQVGTYFRLTRALRTSGWLNLFLGALTLYFGITASNPNILSIIQTILGIGIVVQSFWSINGSSAKILQGLAVVLLICGLYNIFLALYIRILAFSGGFGFDLLLGAFGVYQLWGAYTTYKEYQVYSVLPINEPTDELMEQYDILWERLAHPSPTLSPELVMLQLTRTHDWWNVLLLPDNAVLAHKRQKRLMFIAKSDMALIAENPKDIERERFNILAELDKETLIGKIYRNGFQQYLQWKGIADPELDISPVLARKRRTRKIAWWVMVGILALIGFYIASVVNFMSKYA